MWSDLRFALRLLRRNSGVSLLIVAVMALGIAASTLIFSIASAALLKPLPYRDAERLVLVWDQLRALRLLEFPTSMGIFLDYRERNHSFEQMEVFAPSTATAQFESGAERVATMSVSAGFFPLAGAIFEAGGAFAVSDADSVVLGFGFWRRHFSGNRQVVGRTLIVDNRPRTIAGVAGPGFRFRLTGEVPELFTPIRIEPDAQRSSGRLRVLARLRPGVTMEQARADMTEVARQLGAEHKLYRGPRGEDAGYTVAVVGLREQMFGAARGSLLFLLAATLVMVAITCVNIAQLFLEWRLKRGREFAVRKWLGATKGRLVRQCFLESLLLAVAGGALGLLLSSTAAEVLYRVLPRELSALDGLAFDWRVFLYAAGLCTLSGLFFGVLMPAQGGAASGARVIGAARRPVLVAAQTAFSVVLLVSAILLLRSLNRLESVDPGFERRDILTAQLSLSQANYREPARMASFWNRLAQRLSTEPGISGAAFSSVPPLGAGTGGDPFSIEGRPFRASGPAPQFAHAQVVSTGYFPLLGIRILEGRGFEERDANPDTPVTVINETLARGFWPRESPIGKRIVLGAPRPGVQWMTIIGVAADVHSASLVSKPLPQIYRPLLQEPVRSATLLVRTNIPAARLRDVVAAFDRETPLYGLQTMEDRLREVTAQPRFRTGLLISFGAAAVLLAAFGIYSVTAYRVAGRRKEIGLRMVFGASTIEVLEWVAGDALRPVGAGTVIGMLAALAANRLVAGFLFGIASTDAISYLAAAGLFLIMALAACLPAAWRATRFHPSETLRCQ